MESPALPEWIVASPSGEASYFVERLGGLAVSFNAPLEAAADERDLLELSLYRGVGSFRTLSPAQRSALEGVFDVFSRLAGRPRAGSAGSP
jgi:hypothetical protein